jgi:hypothetical protein
MRGISADIILTLHFGYVLFVVAGLIAIWMGAALRWSWVRNPWFRYSHLVAIGLVVVESIVGIQCPLTVWENRLRGGTPGAFEEEFIQSWIHPILFYQLPPWLFTIAYVAFGALVVGSLLLVKPRRF